MNGSDELVRLGTGANDDSLCSARGLSVHVETLHTGVEIRPEVEVLVWMLDTLDRFSQHSGGAFEPVLWLHSSGIYFIACRDNREVTPVTV